MHVDFETLKGLTLTNVTVDAEFIVFDTACGRKFTMRHFQDCCEAVYVEDVCGDIEDIIGSPILVAEEVVSDGAKPYRDNIQAAEFALKDGNTSPAYDESHTWTFYKLDTAKGGLTIRWLGMSNGYYSESVSFYEGDENY